MKDNYNNRKHVMTTIFIIVGVILALRLFYLQVIDTKYKISAQNNVLRHVTQYPLRGLIYDRNGKLLVYNEASYDLMVVPRQVRELDTLEFCTLLGISEEEFEQKMQRARNFSHFRPSIFERQLSKETYATFQEKLFRFPGFYVQPRTLRKYPNPIAALTLGYIGEVSQSTIDNDPYYRIGDYIGVSGLENTYEKELRGQKGLKIKLVDVHNREQGSYKDGIFDTVPVHGNDLFTTIDMELQAYGELLMSNKKGAIVAIEPSTGEILALVSTPSFDPNILVGSKRSGNFSRLFNDPDKPLFNRALMAQYPPGSAFKMVNALIALNEGVVKPETRIGCARGYHFRGLTVRCHQHPNPTDVVSSIQFSCNAYYCQVFRSILDNNNYKNVEAGFNAWRNYLKSFGLGIRLGTDLPAVGAGNVPTSAYYDKYHGRNRWRSITVISLAIGQGELGITPLQLANMATIIANRGYYYTPHIVKAVGTPDNHNDKFTTKHHTKIDQKHFEPVVEGMFQVMEAGTGRWSRHDSITICGKTGTVQNPHGENHSTFIAFAPKDEPKIAISVFVENSGYGSVWAAPIASLMIEKYLTGKVKRKELEQRMIDGNLMSAQ